MHIRCISNPNYMVANYYSRVRFGEKGSVPIDQTPSQSFNIDPNTGRPMSDIQKLVKMQNVAEQQAAFAGLSEFKSNFLPSDIKDEDALKFMCPRLSQLPSELLSFREGLVKAKIAEQAEQQLKQAAEQKAKADKEYMEKFRKELVDASNKKSD